MIVESAILAWVLSQPIVESKELDMTYKPCATLYADYVELRKTDYVKSAILGENIRYLCTPYNTRNEQ